MKNTLFIAQVAFLSENFSGYSLDKNGEKPVVLTAVAGEMPNRNIMSGTVAKSAGLEPGKAYLVQSRETEASDEYGRQFVFTKIGEPLGAMDIIKAQRELGDAKVFDVGVSITETVNSAAEEAIA